MRSAAFVLVMIALLPATGLAASPGLNLNWNNCLPTTANTRLTLACDDNGQSRSLVVSFRLPTSIPGYVGASANIACVVASGTLPPWWQVGSGQCREGAFAPRAVGPIEGCTNPYSGAGQAGGFVTDPLGRPSWFRIRADWARDSRAATSADTIYTAMVFQLRTDKAVDEGQGVCEGCDVPACFILSSLQLFDYDYPGIFAELWDPIYRNDVYYQQDPYGLPCSTPTRTGTWGAVKALYR